jgi:D-threo-aldose 1-dehydrogenase
MIPRVKLPTGDFTTAIGFGGSGLRGGADAFHSRKLVEVAFAAGIRHFDVAPSYGHGLAEDILGEALAPVREQVTIATKVGIARPAYSGFLSSLRGLARPLRRIAPPLWTAAANRARVATRLTGQFAPEYVHRSLDESLRRLRTDNVDLYLMHEMTKSDATPELLEKLIALQSAGRIGAIGIGASIESVRAVSERFAVFATVCQTNWSIIDNNLPSTESGTFLITHGSIRRAMRPVREFLRLHPAILDDGSRAFDRDLRDDDVLADLLLAAALMANRAGIVLVSSSREDRIRRFAAVAADRGLAKDAAQLTKQLAAMIPASGGTRIQE